MEKLIMHLKIIDLHPVLEELSDLRLELCNVFANLDSLKNWEIRHFKKDKQ